jgi:hypothetical protein
MTGLRNGMSRTVDDGHAGTSLGLYVLGALPESERSGVAEHLCRCATCRGEWVELRDVPVALGMLSEADVCSLIGSTARP